MATKILVGADPEMFLRDPKTGMFTSAHGVIPGSKELPFKVDKGAVQVDGMAVEFNINPAEDEDAFVGNIQTVMQTLRAMCSGFDVVAEPVADFPLEYIQSQPDEARELGCDPDYNAYTGMANVKPNGNLPMRTASGHVHIGFEDGVDADTLDHDNNCRTVAQQMDFFLGLPSLFWDDDQRRRVMYGNPGCYRRKVYGVEYRTLSNAWLRSEELMRYVYKNVQKGMQALVEGKFMPESYGDVRDIILKSDKKQASQILNHMGVELP